MPSTKPTPATQPPNSIRPFRRKVLAQILAAILAVGATLMIGSPSAQAMVIGGCGSTCDIYNPPVFQSTPGSVVIAVDCTPGLLRIDPNANVLSGYTNGQYLSYRYHVTNNRGYVATSGWLNKAHPVPYREGNTFYPIKSLPGTAWSVPRGLRWTVQVQIAYYTGSQWLYQWHGPTNGYSRGSTFTWATCDT